MIFNVLLVYYNLPIFYNAENILQIMQVTNNCTTYNQNLSIFNFVNHASFSVLSSINHCLDLAGAAFALPEAAGAAAAAVCF